MIIDFRSKNSGGGSGDAYSKAETDELLAKKANSTELTEEKGRAEQAEEVLDGKIVANTEAIQNKADKSTTYTKDEVDSALSSKADTSAITDIDSKLQSKADSSDVNAIAEQLFTTQEIVAQKANIGDSYTKAESDSKFLTEHQDISGKQDVIADLETIREGAALGATAIQEHQSLAEYAKTADMAATYQPKGDYITKETDPIYTADKPNIALKSEIPSLDGYATEQWVENKNYITGYTESDPIWNAEKGNYYTKTEADDKFLTEHQDISGKLDKTEAAETYQPKGDYITEESDPIWNAEKGNYYTKSEVDSNIDNIPLKTINGESIKGNGNIVIGGSSDAYTKAESDALLANKTNTNLDNISDEGKENLKNMFKGSKTNLWNVGELSHTITSDEAAQKWYINYDAEIFKRWGSIQLFTQGNWKIFYNSSNTVTFNCTGTTQGIEVYDKATDAKLSSDADMSLTVPENSFYIKFNEGLDIATNDFDYMSEVFYSGDAPLYEETDPVWNKEKTNYYTKNESYSIFASKSDLNNYSSSTQVNTALANKANSNLSNASLKTINGQSLKGMGDITIKGGDEHFKFNPEEDIVNGIAVYAKERIRMEKNVSYPNGSTFMLEGTNLEGQFAMIGMGSGDGYIFNVYDAVNVKVQVGGINRPDGKLEVYKNNALVVTFDSDNTLQNYDIPFSELNAYTFKYYDYSSEMWSFYIGDYSEYDILKPTLLIGDSEGAYVVRNSVKKEIATTDNYAELTFVDIDGNETTLFLLKKN